MAASRVGSPLRWWKRYRYFFYIAGILMLLQFYLMHSFYSINEDERVGFRQVQERLESLERHHELDHKMQGDTHLQIRDHLRHPADLNMNQLAQLRNGSDIKSQRIPPPHLNPVIKTGNSSKPFKAKCRILSKDAVSALERARTEQCKMDIADAICQLQKGTLFPSKLPRRCPLQSADGGKYVGCFQDRHSKRILNGHHGEFKNTNTPTSCMNHCLRAGFEFAGVQFSHECWCGQQMPSEARMLDESKCNSQCPGNSTLRCGGFLAVSIYHTGFGKKGDNPASLVRAADLDQTESKVKIVFVLTINGRAFRQVKRLFKALYDTQHYFYIHVDSRQDYLHREVSVLAEQFDNVRLAKTRLSTIWGGASLLTMLLQCMKDLLAMDDWHWDYFINLSESDYPIKRVDDLVAFLTTFKRKNFVKSHGRDTPRFIRKQGLDKMFFECDNHMWRLGPRTLPDGIRVDGGSDWVGLHYDFCKYVINSDDTLLRGLKNYWKYALLPAESFFHTVLQNTEFCTTVINNNLHLTNWRRKQGCKCQYKHIVDWCGCSPNDFKPSDLDKLLSMEDVPVFFARKFEAVINQEIINVMDTYLFGKIAGETPSTQAYWQNCYHHLDPPQALDDAPLTFYHTFANLSTQIVKASSRGATCDFRVREILEANIYMYSDTFQGLLVKYRGHSIADQQTYTLETLLQNKQLYRVLKVIGPAARLKFLQVGTNFDPKEELFRNFGNLLGPYSEVTLMHSWGAGSEFRVTVVFIDPASVIAASYDLTVKPEEYIGTHTPLFSFPRRPGMWTVKLMYMWEAIAEVQFLVTPLAFYNHLTMDPQTAKLLHNGPPNFYTDRDFSQFADMVGLADTEAALKTAEKNSLKTGPDLQQWIEELIGGVWRVAESCIEDDLGRSSCQTVPECRRSKWSSLYPDPKSEITEMDVETGRLR